MKQDVTLDTNIFLRFVTEKPEKHANQVKQLLTVLSERDLDVYYDAVILLEFNYVLKSAYGFSTKAINKAVEKTFLNNFIKFKKNRSDTPIKALQIADRYNIKFADAMIIANLNPDEIIVSFDERDFRKVRGINFMTPRKFIKKFSN